MQILLLLIFLLPSASGADLWPFGGGGGNATKIRGVNVKTSLGCTDGQILKYVSANSQFECANDAGGVGSGDVGGGSGLTTAGAGLYVLSNSTVAQDPSWTRVAAGQYKLYNATGPNTLTLQGGSSQSTNSLLALVDNAAVTRVTFDNIGQFSWIQSNGTTKSTMLGDLIRIGSAKGIYWSNSAGADGTLDLGLLRSSANNLAITNGSSTTYWTLGAGGILAGTDNSIDIGASGASRPKDYYGAGNGTFGGYLLTSSNLFVGSSSFIAFNSRSLLTSSADGLLLLRNNAGTGFTRLQFGSTTNSFAALGFDAVNGFTIQSAAGTSTYNDASTSASGTVTSRYLFGLAAPTLTATNASVTYTTASTLRIGGAPTASTNVTIGTPYALEVAAGNSYLAGNLTIGGSIGGATGISTTGSFLAGASGIYYWTGRSVIASPANGNITISNQLANDFSLLQFGGTTSSFPALKRSTTELQAKLADDSAFTAMRASGYIVNGATGSNCLLADGTTGACGGATASSSLTDSAVTRTSGTVVTVAAGRWGKGNASMAAHPGNTFTITTLSVTGATNASPIVLTVSSTTGTSLRNGDTVMVSGVGGNTAANGTWVVEVQTATTIALTGSTGNGSYTSGGTVAGSGNGTAVIYGSAQGYTVIDSPASAGLILTCSSTCVMNQSTTPAVPSDGIPLGEVTIVSGAWATASDTRRFLGGGGSDVQAGTGIVVSTAAGTATVSTASDVMRTGGTSNVTGTINATAATRTAPFRTGSGAPTGQNGTTGDTYYQTDATAGQNLWLCTTGGTPCTWTQLTGSGSGYNAHDQARIDEADEFLSASTTSGSIGEMGWAIANGQGSGTVAYQTNPGTARWGVVRLTTGTSNDDNSGLALGGVSAINATTNWEAQWIVSPVSTTSVQYYVGLTAGGSLASNTIGFRFDTGASHTNWQFESCSASTCTTTDSGVAVTAGSWYRLRVRTTSSGSYLFSVNGGSETTISTNVPTTSNMRLTAIAHTRTAAAKDLDIDRFSLTRTGISR